MEIQPDFFKKPDFWIGIVLLIVFFIPIGAFSWLDTYARGTNSGFQVMLGQNQSVLSFILLGIPLAAGYLVFCSLTGSDRFVVYVKKSILVVTGVFLIITIFSTFYFGFWLTAGIGGYWWWQTSRSANSETPKNEE
jgi:hypothetical protein